MIKKLFAILFCVTTLSNCADIVEGIFDAALDLDTYDNKKKKPQKTGYERFQEDMNKTYKNDETIIETDYQREQRELCIKNGDCEGNVWIRDK